MGLSLYFHKCYSNYDTIAEVVADNNNFAKEQIASIFETEFAILEQIPYGTEEYNNRWIEFYNNIRNFSRNTDFLFEKLMHPLSVEEARILANEYLSYYYAPYDLFFGKMSFIYKKFENKLIDNYCFVTKNEIQNILNDCNQVLENHLLAPSLLPLSFNEFFGINEYSTTYFNNVEFCKNMLTTFLQNWNEFEKCYLRVSK